jgi:hypothetical protein
MIVAQATMHLGDVHILGQPWRFPSITFASKQLAVDP